MSAKIENHPRDYRVDSVRGALILVMALNHTNGAHRQFTYETFGYVSAAEGFVMLSAVLVGIRAWSYAARGHAIQFYRRLFKQCFRIYLYHALATLCLACVAAYCIAYYDYWAEWYKLFYSNPSWATFLQLALLHNPFLFDLLPLYILLLFASPIICLCLAKGLWLLPLLLSGYLYFLGLSYHPVLASNLIYVHEGKPGYFNPLSWQLLWVMGLYLGYFLNSLRIFYSRQSLFYRSLFLTLLSSLVLLLCFDRHQVIDFINSAGWINSRREIGLLRVINCILLSLLLIELLGRLKAETVFKPLHLLGRFSLQVFAFHIVVVYLARPFEQMLFEQGTQVEYALFVGAMLLSLFLPVWVCRQARTLNQKRWSKNAGTWLEKHWGYFSSRFALGNTRAFGCRRHL